MLPAHSVYVGMVSEQIAMDPMTVVPAATVLWRGPSLGVYFHNVGIIIPPRPKFTESIVHGVVGTLHSLTAIVLVAFSHIWYAVLTELVRLVITSPDLSLSPETH